MNRIQYIGRDWRTKHGNRAQWEMKKKYFTKKCCLNCVYARTETGQSTRSKQGKGLPLVCERLLITGETCLIKGEDGKVYDRRGEDPENCLLKKRRYVRRKRSD